MEKICTFFGHRDTNLTIKPLLKHTIRNLIEEHEVTTFWIGGYGTFDKCAAQILRNLQIEYPFIKIILIIAYVDQLNRYGDTLPFDCFDYPTEVEVAPRKFAISARNRYMAKNTDFVIAYVQKEYGGAYDAMKIAKNNKKAIINLAEQKTGSFFNEPVFFYRLI